MRTHLIIASLALALAACGEDDHHHHSEAADSHACEHVTGGPYADVTAAVDAADAVEAFEMHHLVTVALVDLPAGQKGGVVQVTAPESGDFRFLLTDDVPFTVTATGAGDALMFEYNGTPDGCDSAAKAFQVEGLSEGGTYLLSFGPTDTESVGFVMEHQSDDHGHSH